MTMLVRAIVLSALAALASSSAFAQPKAAPKQSATSSGPSNAVQGFSQNRDQPVHIEAKRLDVRDKDKVATFSGDVQVIQGDTEMRCRTLVVFYEKQDEADGKPAGNAKTTSTSTTSVGGGEQRIKKLEARGNVVVTQKDQVATGETALFDMVSNTVTMSGNVVVTQGQNVLRGDRLVVDLTTGVSKVESKNGQGRVQGLFLPGSSGPQVPNGLPGKPEAKPEAKPPARR
jgi:lipopolysaccharide export system protein LptA